MLPINSYSYPIPYLTVFLIYLISSLKFVPGKNSNEILLNYEIRKFSLLLVSYVAIYFIGLRGYIFTDWINYKKNFENCPFIDSSFESFINYYKKNQFEKGFVFYIFIMKNICRTYEVFQLIDYIINLILLYHFFRRYSNNLILSISFYFIFFGLMMDVNLARNCKAILIMLNGIKYIQKRSFFHYLIYVIIAAQFHISAYLYLVLFFCYPVEINRKLLIFLFIVFNCFYLLKIDLLSELLIFLSNTIIHGRLGILLNRYVTMRVGFYSPGITIGYIERFFTFLFVFFNYNNLIKQKRINIFFCNVLYLYCLISLFFATNLILLDRVVPLFIFPYWILYPDIYKVFSRKKKYIFLLVYIFYGSLKIFATYKSYLCYYDNLLFLKMSSTSRIEIINKYDKQ